MNFSRLLKWVFSSAPRRRRIVSFNGSAMELESRQLPAAVAITPKATEAFDGSGNNAANPKWGTAGSDLLRKAKASYGDGVSTPGGQNRPSARAISTAVVTQTQPTSSATGLSNMAYAWGQFIDHDIDLTSDASPAVAFNIAVPKGDPLFDPKGTGTQVIALNRSEWDPATGTSTSNPRQQINDITAFIDGSMIYGSSKATDDSLRTFQGGKLKTGAGNLLPNDPSDKSSNPMFIAGDVRANENIELTSLQTLFVREHNRIAAGIAQKNPNLTDEQIFQQARSQVIAEIQAITYNEFLPNLLGQGVIQPYAGYKPDVNPGIANEFSTAAFRFGHSMVGDDVEFLDDQGNDVHAPVELKDAFFNPNLLRQTGIDSILKYLVSDNAEEIDTHVVNSLQNFLFGPPGAGGMDLAALNIQRGRDHGLADYNTTRAAYGLPKVTSFAQITSDPNLQQQLKALYGDVNNVDLWIGGLAEDHVPGGNLGPTFTRIIADQFTRLRDGNRFYFENQFQGPELDALKHTTLADIVKRNTTLQNVQQNAFIFRTSIEGAVFADGNHDGQLNTMEHGLGGRTVQLLDKSGAVLQTTQTRPDGSFSFLQMPLGQYQVREVLPTGASSTTPSRPIVINKGMKVVGINLGEAGTKPQQPPTKPMNRLNSQVAADSAQNDSLWSLFNGLSSGKGRQRFASDVSSLRTTDESA